MSWRDLDEADIRVRPNRKGSRPRTKERPAHADAVIGRVVAVDRGRYTCLVPAGAGARARTSNASPTTSATEPERVVTAMKARELGRIRPLDCHGASLRPPLRASREDRRPLERFTSLSTRA